MICPYLAHDDARHKQDVVDDGHHPAPLHVGCDVIQQLLVPLQAVTIISFFTDGHQVARSDISDC